MEREPLENPEFARVLDGSLVSIEAFICSAHTCFEPITDPVRLAEVLRFAALRKG